MQYTGSYRQLQSPLDSMIISGKTVLGLALISAAQIWSTHAQSLPTAWNTGIATNYGGFPAATPSQ
jgi:hypothetical protein